MQGVWLAQELPGEVMARFRQVHTRIWRDGWFLDLPARDKLLFIYLFTNESSSIAGIYELPPRVTAFDTGLDPDDINNALQAFEEAGRVYFDGRVIWVRNLRKYHETRSPKVQTAIASDIERVPEGRVLDLYRYEYGIDRVSIPSSISSSRSDLGSESGSDARANNPLEYPPPQTERQKELISHPASAAWLNATRRWPGYNSLPHIIDTLGDKPDEKALKRIWDLWKASGYNSNNLMGILDKYQAEAGGAEPDEADAAWNEVWNRNSNARGIADLLGGTDDDRIVRAVKEVGWPRWQKAHPKFHKEERQTFMDAYHAN